MKTYTLHSYCDTTHLATDRCKGRKELVSTFKDAVRHYTGKEADEEITREFLKSREVKGSHNRRWELRIFLLLLTTRTEIWYNTHINPTKERTIQMKKLNYDYLNAIADNCRAVDDTIGNGMENSVSVLKRYCKENYAKCRESIEELNGFVKENQDIFFTAWHNGYFYDIRGNNGFNEWNFGDSWDVHRDGIRIYGNDYNNLDGLSVMLVSKIGDSREYDHCGIDSALNTDGDAEHWVRAKRLVDGFVRYTERLMTEFEKVMSSILAEQNGRLKAIADATDDAHAETDVKSVKIVYVSIG